ncbi:hypothetical protein [Aeromonas cavernicola]|uniref:Uncharacterized protein n=1 Tax=Aeromonas cavernicola TaxID=1006623 RepID=A0A2H9U477_9GAMM|nr:hypothetical protein [Aeromonas cavernicola]PJG58837.1 hypothetical protein CUC53_10440 [Aeromonas cavernicola]
MGVIERILNIQLKMDVYANEDRKVAGIAQSAIENDFASLTALQQAVLQSFLTQQCSGVTDPGDHHNGCEVPLEGNDLLEAYTFCDDPEVLLCPSCRQEEHDYAEEKAELDAE